MITRNPCITRVHHPTGILMAKIFTVLMDTKTIKSIQLSITPHTNFKGQDQY